jgi:pimeloyl-ACP methyl ester carboxylesterase
MAARSIQTDAAARGGWPRPSSRVLMRPVSRRSHLAGHSMGGAVSALIAMRAPDRVKSLTLVAPGGMAKEINADLLDRYARARSARRDRRLSFRDVGTRVCHHPRRWSIISLRRAPSPARPRRWTRPTGRCSRTGPEHGQGVLAGRCAGSAHDAGGGDLGAGDTVLPCPKPSALPASFAFNVLPELGHMLPEEAPEMPWRGC